MSVDIVSVINLDMKAPNAEIVYANQYDSAGHISAQLLNDGEKWEVPSGANGIVSFRKSDRKGGYYDTTEFGETAVSVSSDRSIISIALDAQTMTTFGPVYMQINFLQNNQRLSTFEFLLQVKKSPIVQSNIESKWFVHLLSLSGITVDDTLTISGRAADAKTTGDKIKAEESRARQAESSETERAVSVENLKINKPATNPDGEIGQLLRTLGDGRTEWTNVGAPTSEQVESAVTDWLDEHPEATTTVEDGAITDKKLSHDVADMFVDGLNYTKIRFLDTDCYIVEIPLHDTEGNFIDPYMSFDTELSPFEYGKKNGTTLSINGMCNIQKTDATWQVPNAISRGEIIFQSDFTGTPKPNDAQYVCIMRDRSFKTYSLYTTSTEMLSDGAYTVFDCYYRLVENSSPVDLTNVTANEDGRVTDLNPNLAIGVKNDKTIVWFACDGRTDFNRGLTSIEVAAKMADLGCTDAWMMDGGGSTSITYKGSKLNRNIDGNGTIDRMIRFSFNIKKENKNDFLTDVYGKIGEEKQNVIQQIIPGVNDILLKNGYLFDSTAYRVQENDDLNNYIKPGRYYCSPNAIAQTVLNSPTVATFVLTVTHMSGSQYIQSLEDLNGFIYRRTNHIYSGENHYTPWRMVTYYSYVQNIQLQNATAGGNNSFYYKSGNIVTVFLDFTPNADATAVTIAILPAGFRPPIDLRVVPQSVANVDRTGQTTYVLFKSNGEITVYMSKAFRAFVQIVFGTNG